MTKTHDRRDRSLHVGGFTRRGMMLGAMTLLLAGCGRSRLGANIATAFRFATVGLPGPEITRDSVNAIPYASIAAKLGKGPRSLLILWRLDGENEHWLSADNAVIVTRRGRILKTAGFPTNLSDTYGITPDPLVHGLTADSTYVRTVDLPEIDRYGIEIRSTFRTLGPETITITELDFETIHVVEQCTARTLNWTFRNHYWLDPFDGFVWRTTQYVVPDFPKFTIEALKPPDT